MDNVPPPPSPSFNASECHIWFQTNKVRAEVAAGRPHAFDFGGFHLVEALLPEKGKPDSKDEFYFIRICRNVRTQEEYEKALEDFKVFQQEIEQVWHYVFGTTYDGDARDFDSKEKARWKDNRYAVYSAVRPNEMPMPILEWSSSPVLQLIDWPLGWVLKGVSSYRSINETYKFLMGLHAKALDTENIDIRLTLLGKLADMCNWLLPRKDRRADLDVLPPLFKNRLVNGLKLFEIANTRSLTRHAMRQDGQLHQGMSPGEIEDFQSDVDTLVRYLVMEQLKVPPTFYEGWRFAHFQGSYRWSGKIGKERSLKRDAMRAEHEKNHPGIAFNRVI